MFENDSVEVVTFLSLQALLSLLKVELLVDVVGVWSVVVVVTPSPVVFFVLSTIR